MHYHIEPSNIMAQQYNQKRDGINGFPGPQVYRVVQQVAHAKPVAQHQPIFYGTHINPTSLDVNQICIVNKDYHKFNLIRRYKCIYSYQ